MARRALSARLFAVAAALLAARSASAQLLFSPCDFSAVGDESQLWIVKGNGIALASDNARCMSMSSGCCFGEAVRGGDLVGLGDCGSPGSMLAWPDASFAAAPNAIVATATRDVSPSINGAPLVVDGRGSAIPQTVAQLRAYRDQASSAFSVNGSSATGARLVHTASGMCLSSGGSRAQVGPTLALAPCDAKKTGRSVVALREPAL
jgi:hypothetical protein